MSQPRDGRYPLDKLGGGGAAYGNVPVWDGSRWVPGAGGGGGALGWVWLYMVFDTVTSDGSDTQLLTSISVLDAWGDHGISVNSGTGEWTFNDDSDGGLYIGDLTLLVSSVTDADPLDVHVLAPNVGLFLGTGTFLGDSALAQQMKMSFAGAGYTAPSVFAPQITARCSGGTDRTYDTQAMLFLGRFAA